MEASYGVRFAGIRIQNPNMVSTLNGHRVADVQFSYCIIYRHSMYTYMAKRVKEVRAPFHGRIGSVPFLLPLD